MLRLSKPQRLIYEMEKYAGGSIAVICGSVLVRGQRDLSELRRAVNEIYRLNEALRIRITEKDGGVWQDVMEYTEQQVPVLRFDSRIAFASYAGDYAKEPVPLSGPLCEIQIVLLPDSYCSIRSVFRVLLDIA